MSHEPRQIRVAISGGGIAGASLFHALLKHPHLDVHIFESAAEFREAGLAVGLAQNAQKALELIGPSATQCFKRAGAVASKGARLILAQGPDAGQMVGQIGGEQNVVGVVHRAAFLRELLVGAPPDRMHASKQLQDIEQTHGDSPIAVRFADGTVHECDVLIGADGIHSRVRRFVLGDADPAATPVSAGWWAIQVLRPYAEAEVFLDKEFFDANSPAEVGWLGDGAVIFHNILSEGQLAQFVVVVSSETGDAPDLWHRVVNAQEIREAFARWPANLSNAVEKLICDRDSHTALYFWEHLPARTYVKDSVALTGDAAHSTTPWQGAGAGMSCEDSLILATLLGRAQSPAEARIALQVYDSVRRPRTQQITRSSNGVGKMVTNRDPQTGLDATRLKEKLFDRWDFILNADIVAHRDEASRQMEGLLRQVQTHRVNRQSSRFPPESM